MFFGVSLIGIKHSNGDSNFRTYCIVIVLFPQRKRHFLFVNKIRIQKKSEDGDKKQQPLFLLLKILTKHLPPFLSATM